MILDNENENLKVHEWISKYTPIDKLSILEQLTTTDFDKLAGSVVHLDFSDTFKENAEDENLEQKQKKKRSLSLRNITKTISI